MDHKINNKLPDKIYGWKYVGSFNTGLGLPVIDMGDTPWSEYIRSDLATYDPKTHVAVPLEPTYEMIMEMSMCCGGSYDQFKQNWPRMIAAAPKGETK